VCRGSFPEIQGGEKQSKADVVKSPLARKKLKGGVTPMQQTLAHSIHTSPSMHFTTSKHRSTGFLSTTLYMFGFFYHKIVQVQSQGEKGKT
jgi:hypothetical protein